MPYIWKVIKFHGSKPPTRSYHQWFPKVKIWWIPMAKMVTWMKYDWMMLMSDITNDKQNWLDDEWIIMKKKTSFRGCWSVLGHFWGWAVWMLLHEVEVHGAPIWWSHPIIYAPWELSFHFYGWNQTATASDCLWFLESTLRIHLLEMD